MKNQRIKADNVDQLLEIVKAVQRGEDPGEALEKVKAEKEKAEAIAMAEAMAAAEEQERLQEEKKAARKKKEKSEKVSEDSQENKETDEFEEALEADRADGISFKETAQNVKGRLQKAAGLFLGAAGSSKKQKRKSAAEKKEEIRREFAAADTANVTEEIQQEYAVTEDAAEAEKPEEPKQQVQPETAGQAENQIQVSEPEPEMYNESGNTSDKEPVENVKEEVNAESDAVSNEEPERTQEEMEADQEKLARLFEYGTGGGRMLGRERLSSRSASDSDRKRVFRDSEKNIQSDSDKETNTEKRKNPLAGIGASFAGMWKILKEKDSDEESEFEQEFLEAEEDNEQNLKKRKKTKEEVQNPADSEEAKEGKQKPGDSEEADEEQQKSGDSEEAKEETQNPEDSEEVKEEKQDPEDLEEESEDTQTVKKKAHTWKKPSVQGIKDYLQKADLSKRGLTILGAAALLIILLAVVVVNVVHYSVDQKKKRENVAADKGLIVTVENDPQEWCSSHMLELRFKTKGKPITKVVINGTSLQPDADGNVTYAASEYRLEATAVTEDMTYQAVIEIPKLDAQAPTVYAQRSADQVVLTASDDRSSIRKIWYAELEDNDFIRLPVYQEYTGAIPYQKGSFYYYYAEDAAGNCSTPVVTTMELAESLVFGEECVMMYPDETVYLDVQVLPAGALLNGLQFTSSNPSVASVDGRGKVTALEEGTATITVSAEGVAEISCQVEVARERTVTISAIGDCTLGADQSFNTTINFDAFAAVNGNDYFFQNVADILANDDVTFANLEGTLTTSNTREIKQYAFKGDPSYTEILTSGSVEVVTLANNHSSDYGEQSLTDTQMYLTEAGIDYCMGDTYVLKNVNGVKTAFIGIYVLRDGMERETQVREMIAKAKDDGADLVITAFHWGSEKETEPDETQKSLAHIAVDCGADLVVGHHPHVLQGIEKYNGKYIAYSLGNFCFGGNTAPSDTDTMIFRQTFTIRDGEVQADDQIEIIPCSITSAEGYNNYQPVPADEARTQRIMERINQYSEPFGQTYTASTGLE